MFCVWCVRVYGHGIYCFDYTFCSAIFVFFLLKLILFSQNSQQNQTGFLSFSPHTVCGIGQATTFSYFTFPIHNRPNVIDWCTITMWILRACVIQEIKQIFVIVSTSLKNLLIFGCTTQRNSEADLMFTMLWDIWIKSSIYMLFLVLFYIKLCLCYLFFNWAINSSKIKTSKLESTIALMSHMNKDMAQIRRPQPLSYCRVNPFHSLQNKLLSWLKFV